MRRAALVAALVALAVPAAAGPWNSPRGRYYAKLGYGFLRATRLATPLGEVVDIPAFTRHEASLYAQIGLTPRLMGVVDLALYRRSEIERFDEAGGVGDTRFGLQWHLGRSGAWVFAARSIAQAPTGDETLGQALLPTGSGVWEGEGVVGAGRSLWSGRGWAFAEAGYQARGGGLRDGLVYGAQLGVRAASRVLLMANLRGVQPWDTAPSDLSTTSPAGFGDRTTYLTWGPAVIVELGGGAGIQADLDLLANTRNIAHGPTLRLGVFVSR